MKNRYFTGVLLIVTIITSISFVVVLNNYRYLKDLLFTITQKPLEIKDSIHVSMSINQSLNDSAIIRNKLDNCFSEQLDFRIDNDTYDTKAIKATIQRVFNNSKIIKACIYRKNTVSIPPDRFLTFLEWNNDIYILNSPKEIISALKNGHITITNNNTSDICNIICYFKNDFFSGMVINSLDSIPEFSNNYEIGSRFIFPLEVNKISDSISNCEFCSYNNNGALIYWRLTIKENLIHAIESFTIGEAGRRDYIM